MRPVLYIESDERYAALVRRTFTVAQMARPLRVIGSFREAERYVAGAGDYADRINHPLPALILLDLMVGGQSGLELIGRIRAKPDLAAMPVVVFTASTNPEDVKQASAAGAAGYLVKPRNPVDLTTVVRSMKYYWLVNDQMLRQAEMRVYRTPVLVREVG